MFSSTVRNWLLAIAAKKAFNCMYFNLNIKIYDCSQLNISPFSIPSSKWGVVPKQMVSMFVIRNEYCRNCKTEFDLKIVNILGEVFENYIQCNVINGFWFRPHVFSFSGVPLQMYPYLYKMFCKTSVECPSYSSSVC